jgi:hypothetical protein
MAKKTKATRARAPKPRADKKPSQLPLIKQVRHEKLDGLCESIGRSIDKRNRLERDEEADKQAALDYMVKHQVTAYSHFGTDLITRPGATKLIARKHKGEAASTMPGDEAL